MKLIFFGTPAYAARYLTAAQEIGAEIVGVVTQPDRPRGRGLDPCPPPVKEEAERLRLCVWQPESCRAPELLEEVAALAPDIILVVAYGQILCPELLAIPRVAALNVHYSLLPRLRGPAPVAHALLAGLPETGVTLQYMSERVDAGDIVAQARLTIQEEDDTASLTGRLTELGCQLIKEWLPQVMAGTAPRFPQNESEATWAPRLTKADGLINWNESATRIVNRIRATTPWPGALTAVQTPERRLLIRRARVRLDRVGTPGQILEAPEEGQGLIVAAGEGAVELLLIQPLGRRTMSVEEYWRGARLTFADKFISLSSK